jgi:hypothetical protein
MSRDEWEQSITTWWNEHKAMLRFVVIAFIGHLTVTTLHHCLVTDPVCGATAN